jgi:hypothetical protein
MAGTSPAMTSESKHNTGEVRSPVSYLSPGLAALNYWLGVVVGRLNSKCPQQDRTDESEHGAYGEHIQSQGKVHGSASLVDVVED